MAGETSEQFNIVNGRISKLEDFKEDMMKWRSTKDAIDAERHQQNLNKISELNNLSAANGAKLDTLILRTASEDGAEKQKNKYMKTIAWFVGVLAASGIGSWFLQFFHK